MKKVKINWPNKKSSNCTPGVEWLKAAYDANIEIPSGCLGGSCGACEIEVNGEIVRACITSVPDENELEVEFFKNCLNGIFSGPTRSIIFLEKLFDSVAM